MKEKGRTEMRKIVSAIAALIALVLGGGAGLSGF